MDLIEKTAAVLAGEEKAPRVITERETQVLRLLALGCTYCQIADRLGVSLHTVTSHIKNLYRKLRVRSAAAAVMRGVQLHLLQHGAQP